MTAKPNVSLFAGSRLWLWVLAFFGMVLLVMIVVYLVKKKQGGQQPKPLPAPAPSQTYPPTTPTSTPPIIPPETPTNTSTGSQGGSKPVDVYNANWAYVQEIAWKMHDTYFDRNNYKCEITNGIIEMGDNDLRALVQLYKQWYNRNLQSDYCKKITSSGCWTTWWDDKPETACSRLKQLQ